MRRRTAAFAIAIVKFSRAIQRTPENDVLKRQLTKAGTGIGATYRASCRSRSDDEWLSRLAVAVEEADESEYWLTVMDRCNVGEIVVRTKLKKDQVS